MSQSIEKQIVSRVYGNGRGWAFSPRDFSQLGTREAIDLSLHRLTRKGTIRRVTRGLYDYPEYSQTLDRDLSPDLDQVAQALARKFGWRIQPSGPAALNALGLSTQVPGRVLYLSDGPDRKYDIANTVLEFRSTPLKESGFQLRESSLIVQALKSLGREGIDSPVIQQIRAWLDPTKRSGVLNDTGTVTGWVYAAIRKICEEEPSG